MADNVTIQSGTPASAPAGTVFAADDVGGVKYERVKLDFGGDGQAAPATETTPFPVGLEDMWGHKLEATFMRDLKTVQPHRLVGANFFGTTIDANEWTSATSGAGAATSQASFDLTISSGTANSGYGQIRSTRPARFIFANPNCYRATISVTSTTAALNTRRWGAFTVSTITPQNGFYFELSAAGVLSIVSCKAATPTAVASGSFNGAVSSFTMDTNIHAYEIKYSEMRVEFYIDNVLIHTLTPTTTLLVADYNLYAIVTSSNSASGVTNGVVDVYGMSIIRYGKETTAPQSVLQSGTTAGLVMKRGMGTLRYLVLSAVANTSAITLYDNTAASGTVLWQSGVMGAITTPFVVDLRDIPYFTGLTLVIATASSTVVAVFE